MASFRIHEDQENDTVGRTKENVEIFTAAPQRRALGDLNHFTYNQNRNVKQSGLTNGHGKVQDENRTARQVNDKAIVPPVAQFRAFNVYEDKNIETDIKKIDSTFQPFAVKDINKSKFQINAENCKNINSQNEKDCKKEETTAIRAAFKEKQDVLEESPMSLVHDSSVMSISRNDASVLDEDDKDAVTAQTDREFFFHVIEYRQDIYEYMREIEVKHRPNPRYMRKQPHISSNMRSILVDWLAEVCEEYSQQTETLHLAVSYVDRFLSYMSVIRDKLQLVGTAATFIAAKYEEVYPPEVSDLVYITDNTYTKREVLRMEHLMLKVLSFDLSTPTSLAFLSHYCIANGVSKKTFHLASYIIELSLLEADPYLHFKPSVIAAASLATARHSLLCQHCDDDDETKSEITTSADCGAVAWPANLIQISGYKMVDLEICARHLARSHAHAAQQPHQAIPDKYKNYRLDCVSSLEPRSMYPVPKYQPPVAKTEARPPETRPSGDPVLKS